MTLIQALLIAILQGATELFPVSSLGHAVILPPLLQWPIDQHGESFLPFLVMLHLGTAVALFLYFRRDWTALATGVLGMGDQGMVREARRVLCLLVVATIPAVLVGGLLEHKLRILFASPVLVALMLAANGGLLLAGEKLRGRAAAPGHEAAHDPRSVSALSMSDALIIGAWQCLALIPGFSRSGATMVGGLLRGVDHARSAHFSFLIALPIILGATVLEVPKLLHASVPHGVFGQAAVAAVISGIVAYLSTMFLMRYFRHHDNWALNPFAYYCVAVGLGSAAALCWL
jgi:undecaprenyl-diphosphatase